MILCCEHAYSNENVQQRYIVPIFYGYCYNKIRTESNLFPYFKSRLFYTKPKSWLYLRKLGTIIQRSYLIYWYIIVITFKNHFVGQPLLEQHLLYPEVSLRRIIYLSDTDHSLQDEISRDFLSHR